jgi:Protein of unknown function (DUF2934)
VVPFYHQRRLPAAKINPSLHGQADQHWLAAEREILAASTPALAREPAPKKKRRSPARSKAARTLALAG